MKQLILSFMIVIYSAASYSYTSCSSEQYLVSYNSTFATSIKFANVSDNPVKLYWINYSGKREFLKQIAANSVYVQQTYTTHPWVVTDKNNNCLNVYYPDGQQRVINIQ